MAAKSISFCQGKGSLAHNNRAFYTKNIDRSRTADNIVYVKQPIAEAYEQCFGEALQRYNDKQVRADRKIKTSYYEDTFKHAPCNAVVTSSDKRKSFYEDVVQIGTMGDTGIGTADGKLAIQCLDEYMKDFSDRNPNFHVFNAVLHADEATPHIHIDYIPIGHYGRGMDTQNGLAQALKEMGYGTGKDAINKWRLSERAVLEKICRSYGIDISEPQASRGSLLVDEYKKYAKIKEQKEKIEREAHEIERRTLEKEKEYKYLSEKAATLNRNLGLLESKYAERTKECAFIFTGKPTDLIYFSENASLSKRFLDNIPPQTRTVVMENLIRAEKGGYIKTDLTKGLIFLTEEGKSYISRPEFIKQARADQDREQELTASYLKKLLNIPQDFNYSQIVKMFTDGNDNVFQK